MSLLCSLKVMCYQWSIQLRAEVDMSQFSAGYRGKCCRLITDVPTWTKRHVRQRAAALKLSGRANFLTRN